MSKPIWKLFIDTTDTSVAWIDYKANSRFAIYSAGTIQNKNDDLVLDKETGLIWPRNGNLLTNAVPWLDANTMCRTLKFANRIGWRLPTVEELSSLVDVRFSNPALPAGHPFLAVQTGEGVSPYWTSTNYENPSTAAWFVNLGSGDAGTAGKGGEKIPLGFVWPVRGGRGGVNWNW